MKHATRRILIVDDHPIVRRGYAFLMAREADLEICGEAATVAEALDTIPECEPDLAIVDITLEGVSGLELIKEIRRLYPAIAVLVVTMHDESEYGERAIAAGARGYVVKTDVDTNVVKAVRTLLAGGYFVGEKLSSRLFDLLRTERRAASSPLDHLTDRELEVFEMLGHGKTIEAIATALMISPKTVESHCLRMKQKLGLHSGRDLLLRAVQSVQESEAGVRREGSSTGPSSRKSEE